nr:anchored repeat ABC transporter, substrate-binding protein [Corynebacterium sp. 13CS0277]
MAVVASATACSQPSPPDTGEKLQIVATTPLFADMVRQVAMPTAHVSSIVPNGADPHTFEPTLRTIREIAHADLIVANGLFFEDSRVLRTVQAVKKPGTPVVFLAEDAPAHGGYLLPLVEDAALDTVWLGVRVDMPPSTAGGASAAGSDNGAATGSEAEWTLVGATVPPGGRAVAFQTATFGQPYVLFDSDEEGSSTRLPRGAHTHVSWAFNEPGYYALDLEAATADRPNNEPPARAHLLVAVGVDPYAHPLVETGTTPDVIDRGHADVTLRDGELVLVGDPATPGDVRPQWDLENTVVSVPATTVMEIPRTTDFRFLGRRGEQWFVLRQAVVGRHIHGDTDPHAWLDPANGIAYLDSIAAALSQVDPGQRAVYQQRSARTAHAVNAAGEEIRRAVAAIPPGRRGLVTTHDGFGYLTEAYGLRRAGVVAAHAGLESTPRARAQVAAAIEGLQLPAVFRGPLDTTHQRTLEDIAGRAGVKVCVLYGEVLDPREGVDGYVPLLQHTARELRTCLGTEGGRGTTPLPQS